MNLSSIITTSLELTSYGSAASAPLPPGLTSPQEVVAANLGRMVGGWLKLQDAVAALMDSTLAENGGAGGQGIRQALEKKEGLFRKNMMGKRVNFAARCVRGGAAA